MSDTIYVIRCNSCGAEAAVQNGQAVKCTCGVKISATNGRAQVVYMARETVIDNTMGGKP